MSKKMDAKQRAKYTLEFKLEAVRLVKAREFASLNVCRGSNTACQPAASNRRNQSLTL